MLVNELKDIDKCEKPVKKDLFKTMQDYFWIQEEKFLMISKTEYFQ